MMKINEQTIRIACELLTETLIAKNRDYGNSVEEQFNEYGEASLLIRLDDKLRRLKQLQNAPANVTGESKRDTMLDLAGYAILGLLCLSSDDKREVRQLQKSPFELVGHDINFNHPYFDQDDQ